MRISPETINSGEMETHSLLAKLLEMHECADLETEQEIIQRGLEHAVALTGSRIGYLHFVNEDQETVELVTWSKGTLALCTAVYDRHYPISSAGVWADCARFRRPFIHNDYPSLPNRAGYPQGHAELKRHLGVPVIDRDLVRILLGVGNKPEPYDEYEIAILQQIGGTVWRLVQRRREHDRLRAQEKHMLEVQKIVSVTSWECDPEENSITFDHVFSHIFNDDRPLPMPIAIDEMLEFFDMADRQLVKQQLFSANSGERFYLEVQGVHSDGHTLPVALQGHVLARPRGEAMIIHGILRDLSERDAMDEIREKAFHDPLTGLGNRNMLMDRIQKGLAGQRRRPTDYFAVHYVDLDRFKSVNDHFGHRIGDAVLREVARRMRKLIRQEDLVVRLGGDEFMVLQSGIENHGAAEALAEKINQAMNEPVYVEGITLSVGASIGIVLSKPADSKAISELIDEADSALYRCKAHHPGSYVVSGSESD
jgi:diguanylate cyclase (GGDEF)-like protein